MIVASDPVRHFFSLLFSSSSSEAHEINTLFLRYLILAGIIVLLVGGLVIGGAIRFRARGKQGEPIQISGNKRLELLWTIIPAAILAFFFVLTLRTMIQINQKADKNAAPDVVVIAHQWWWDIRYPKYHIITANELHIPVGKKWLMRVESADVIHDWWVPDLGRKIDAVPGRSNYTWISADSPGTYLGACSEYCGGQHAWMRISVMAETQQDFDEWVSDQQHTPEIPKDNLALEGAKLFQTKTCANCHAIANTPADAHIGPDLSHLGSRQTILSGMLMNNKENLTRWLHNPQQVKEGALMPDFQLNKQEEKCEDKFYIT